MGQVRAKDSPACPRGPIASNPLLDRWKEARPGIRGWVYLAAISIGILAFVVGSPLMYLIFGDVGPDDPRYELLMSMYMTVCAALAIVGGIVAGCVRGAKRRRYDRIYPHPNRPDVRRHLIATTDDQKTLEYLAANDSDESVCAAASDRLREMQPQLIKKEMLRLADERVKRAEEDMRGPHPGENTLALPEGFLLLCNEHTQIALTLLSHPRSDARALVVEALRDMPAAVALEPLMGVVRNKGEEDYIRDHAAWTLGEIGDPRAVEPLITYLREDKDFPSDQAARSLGLLGDRRAIPVLREVLEKLRARPIPPVAYANAIRALAKLEQDG